MFSKFATGIHNAELGETNVALKNHPKLALKVEKSRVRRFLQIG
tara:strand:- start:287 stop:418 length:132 start_codon:yes stop_codon:yes gene_type:complete